MPIQRKTNHNPTTTQPQPIEYPMPIQCPSNAHPMPIQCPSEEQPKKTEEQPKKTKELPKKSHKKAKNHQNLEYFWLKTQFCGIF